MSTEEQRKSFITLAEKLELLVGNRLWITESITDRGYDRHGTTNAAFGFTLKQTNWRISGSRLMLNGTGNELYEISSLILNCRIDVSEIEVEELLCSGTTGNQIKRKTKIEIR